MDEPVVTVRATLSDQYQKIRITAGRGGPDHVELLLHVDKNGARLSAWNPFRHEWNVQSLIGLGDTRR